MAKKVEHLKTLSGKVLLFGGIYSNLQALKALKAVAAQENIAPENCICTGDIVGYCAQPEETIQLLKSWGAKSIIGNVEQQLKNNAQYCGCDFKEGSRCDILSQQWYPFAKSKLSKNSIDYIKTLPDFLSFNYLNKLVTVVHGSYFNISEFIFKSTDWSKKAPNFAATNSGIIIAGHCGLPFIDKKDGKVWCNPGVIGMPANNGSSQVWYAILDSLKQNISIKHKPLSYNFTETNKLMLTHNLPEAYANTIVTGIWDNTDILPTTEASLQGLKITI